MQLSESVVPPYPSPSTSRQYIGTNEPPQPHPPCHSARLLPLEGFAVRVTDSAWLITSIERTATHTGVPQPSQAPAPVVLRSSILRLNAKYSTPAKRSWGLEEGTAMATCTRAVLLP